MKEAEIPTLRFKISDTRVADAFEVAGPVANCQKWAVLIENIAAAKGSSFRFSRPAGSCSTIDGVRPRAYRRKATMTWMRILLRGSSKRSTGVRQRRAVEMKAAVCVKNPHRGPCPSRGLIGYHGGIPDRQTPRYRRHFKPRLHSWATAQGPIPGSLRAGVSDLGWKTVYLGGIGPVEPLKSVARMMIGPQADVLQLH